MKMMFADWTAQEMATSFILKTQDDTVRDQISKEFSYSLLLEHAAWFADNLKFGCI